MNDYREYLNKIRIDLINSNEYQIGKKIEKLKVLIKKFKILKTLKICIRHILIKKNSINNQKEYNMICKNKINYTKKRIVVYSCITGNYDNLLDPLYTHNNVDYILFTDNTNISSKIWNIRDIKKIKKIEKLSLVDKNRYIKLNPQKLFSKDYDYAIYIDGNIQVISDIRRLILGIDNKYGFSMHKHRNRNDIYCEYNVCNILKKGNRNYLKKQIKKYKKEGFPKKYGMLEANLFVFDLNNKTSSRIFSKWYKEYIDSKSNRDQISLPYILWKNNILIEDIALLGSDVYKNSFFYIKNHRKGDENGSI